MTLKLGPHCLAQKQDYWRPWPDTSGIGWNVLRAWSHKPGYEELGDLVSWVDKKPSIVKFVSFGKPEYPDESIDDFRLANIVPAGSLVIGRPFESFRLWQGDAVMQARLYFNLHFRRNIEQYSRIDIWEGPNEVGISPGQREPGIDDMMTWYAQFLREFARQCYLRGKRAAIGSWATGTPEIELWQKYRPALDAVHDLGAILACHEYDVPPASEWGWNNLRHRRNQATFSAMGYGRLPVVITECGADGVTAGQGTRRWMDYYDNDGARYWREFCKPYNDALCQDNYVLGATLFTLGTGCNHAWDCFNVGGSTFVPAIDSIFPQPIIPSPQLGLYHVAVGAAWQRTGPGVRWPIALWQNVIPIFLLRGMAFRVVETKNGWGRNISGRWMKLSLLEKI
jgi:hypothetical protein